MLKEGWDLGAGRGAANSGLAAAHSTALDFAANQRSRGGTKDRAGRALTARVDCAANQRTAGSAGRSGR